MICVPMTVSASAESVPVQVSSRGGIISSAIGASYFMGKDAPYEGPVVFTPSAEQQVIQTAGKSIAENIIIDPIPSNYGLVTYNGAFITVS